MSEEPTRYKCRAWDKKGKGFVNGFNMIGFSTAHGATGSVLQRYSSEWSMNEVVLMQSTGLADRNGAEIFEGDIGKMHGDAVLVSFWYGRLVCVLPPDCHSEAEGECKFDEIHDAAIHMEVIGNIHQNPELLTESAQ